MCHLVCVARRRKMCFLLEKGAGHFSDGMSTVIVSHVCPSARPMDTLSVVGRTTADPHSPTSRQAPVIHVTSTEKLTFVTNLRLRPWLHVK